MLVHELELAEYFEPPVAFPTPEMIRWHTRRRPDAGWEGTSEIRREKESCESKLENVGSQAQATAPHSHLAPAGSRGEITAACWLGNSAQEGKWRLCWVKTVLTS